MCDRVPDNYDFFLQHDREMADALERRPKCCECNEHIQDDECFEINDDLYCPKCMNNNFRKSTDDFIEY